ncbi:MAG: biotin--[acetyl-CoA-carboxylase] ligase [Clostridiales Family XIII bacterium]|jgi:BirA family biotin operon repressor/biotin-[acetyl-CoA-carboxylase] ligase|nr:biotin--[acetyl-CoA-carboxylase] ligase [Clostridiales Family XIII bacterium]
MKHIEYSEIDSTNNEAKRRLAAAANPAALSALYGTVLTARRQTAGRGRLGKDFLSPGGDSIYISFILAPPDEAAHLQMITVAAAVAVCRAIEKTLGLRPGIKWVNDVFIDGKKICGILAEAVSDPRPGAVKAVILGIGININIPENDFPETLRASAGSLALPPDGRPRLLDALEKEVFACVRALKNPAALLGEYRARSFVVGKQIFVLKQTPGRPDSSDIPNSPNDPNKTDDPNKKTTPAAAIRITDDGGLEVKYEDGAREVLRSGEVSIRY